jgi:hypothetical protein
MKHIKTIFLGIAATASVLVPLADANAWVAAGRGWGGRGFVAAGHPYHGGAYYHGGGYYHGGCYGCGAAAGAVAGLAVGAVAGAAIASASQPAVVVQQPVYVASPPVYAVQGNLPIGSQYVALPPGARGMTVNGAQYYQSGPNWYKPYFGSSGVYYEVVPTP